MSLEYEAVSGVGLYLTEPEGRNFMLSYIQKRYNPEATKTDIDTLLDCRYSKLQYLRFFSADCEEKLFIQFPEFKALALNMCDKISHTTIQRADALGPYKTFKLDAYDDTCSCGEMYDIADIHNQSQNTIETCSYEITSGYIIWASKSTLPQAILTGNSYKSIDEIITEFKTRIDAYLPDQFAYPESIGFVTYARSTDGLRKKML